MLIKIGLIIFIIGLLLSGCSQSNNKTTANSISMPYKEWRIGGRYPSYFPAKVFDVSMITQAGHYKSLRIAARPNRGDNPGKWHLYLSSADALDVHNDLPQQLNVCWVSFVDQTFYWTTIDVPLAVREQMVIQHNYTSAGTGTPRQAYNNTIILGFAPGGNVTAWLTGVVIQPWTTFSRVQSTNQGQNPLRCPNPYPNGKIPQITPEAKAWLKKHGMPSYWREPAK